MKILLTIGTWIKTHVVATAVISTVVVGGTIATPIIYENIQEKSNSNNIVKETKTIVKENEVLVDWECEEGYTKIVDPNFPNNPGCEKTEVITIPEDVDREKYVESIITKESKNNKDGVKNVITEKVKTEETKPTCNDISCKITESNNIVYYEGKMLFGIKVYQPYGDNVNGWQYNSSLIQNLSKEDRNYVFNNYFKKDPYCATSQHTASDCLRYSQIEWRLDDITKTAKDEITYNCDSTYYNYCITYLQTGSIPAESGWTNEDVISQCRQGDNEPYKWTIADFQNIVNEQNALKSLHNQVINESQSYKQAYQSTRSLLQG